MIDLETKNVHKMLIDINKKIPDRVENKTNLLPKDALPEEIAEAYCKHCNGDGKERKLICLNDEFYLYQDERWVNVKDFKSELTGFLQKYSEKRKGGITQSLVNNVMLNIATNEMARINSRIYSMPCWLNDGRSGEDYILLENCIIDVEKWANGDPDAVMPIISNFFSTMQLPVAYDEKAECPLWEKTLSMNLPNENDRRIAQMLAGLMLVPDTSYTVFFLLFGPPGTGKSTFIETLQNLIGKSNYCTVPYEKLGDRFKTKDLTTHLMNTSDELPCAKSIKATKSLDECLKKIASGDMIDTEEKFLTPGMGRPIARCLFAANELPYFGDRSGATHDRMRIIEFNQVMRNTDKQNPNLAKDLQSELPGILNWALKGLKMLRTHKTFPHTESGKLMVEEHKLNSDHVELFMRDALCEGKGRISERELYAEYKAWAEFYNYCPMMKSNFDTAINKTLKTRECRVADGCCKSARGFSGIQFRDDYIRCYREPRY